MKRAGTEISIGQLGQLVRLSKAGAVEVELARVQDRDVIELAAPRAGLVPVKVKVTNRKGTTFERTMYVRPNQAKSLQQGKGAPKLSAAGADVTKATRGVLEELAKIPAGSRPKGWQDAVKALADFRHGGRLGPEKRRALRAMQQSAPEGSPLRTAVTNALKVDAEPVKRTERRAKRKAEKTLKPNRPGKQPDFHTAGRAKTAAAKTPKLQKKARGLRPSRPAQPKIKAIKMATPSAAARSRAEAKGQTFEGGRFPIRNRQDLENAVRAIGRAKPADREKIKAFIVRRAKALGAMEAIPESWR